ncbi:MAG: type site-specific deoxyribonuclease, HsdR family [Verrucomicrobiaceae bacterium]|nr:type site-specific deoxyribonuclease, HsdR family [Verrucomicrobiaceae bacterium]
MRMPSPADHLRFFNAREEIERHFTVLPHWEQPGATYFVTFRLGDSIPQGKLDEWSKQRDRWLATHAEPWNEEDEAEYHQLFSASIERWLDLGHGACVLRNPKVADIVRSSLQHFQRQRCAQHAFVVMPNHVHVLLTVLDGHSMSDLVHSWKSFTAHEINKLLGISGSLWQRDYFDRMIRDSVHFWNCVRYIRRNPVKACLAQGQYSIFEADWVKTGEGGPGH